MTPGERFEQVHAQCIAEILETVAHAREAQRLMREASDLVDTYQDKAGRREWREIEVLFAASIRVPEDAEGPPI